MQRNSQNDRTIYYTHAAGQGSSKVQSEQGSRGTQEGVQFWPPLPKAAEMEPWALHGVRDSKAGLAVMGLIGRIKSSECILAREAMNLSSELITVGAELLVTKIFVRNTRQFRSFSRVKLSLPILSSYSLPDSRNGSFMLLLCLSRPKSHSHPLFLSLSIC